MDAIYRTVTSILFSIMAAFGIQPPPETWQLHSTVDGRTFSLSFSVEREWPGALPSEV